MTFYLSFGQLHPLRDNWVEVEAASEAEARALILEVFGRKWSGLYDEIEFAGPRSRYFKGGKVGRTLKADGD